MMTDWLERSRRRAAWAERVQVIVTAGAPWGEFAEFTSIGDGPDDYIADKLRYAGVEADDQIVTALGDEVMMEALDMADHLIAEVADFARQLHAIDWSALHG